VLGVIMALYGVVYAVLENDCRRYCLPYFSQVGYMVAGVGSNQMANHGACAHAFAIFFTKASCSWAAVRAAHDGESKFTELGGLWKKCRGHLCSH